MRVDILERLADLIRPAIAYRPGTTPGEPPVGAADGDGFVATVAMTSLVGCSGEDFASILQIARLRARDAPGPGHHRAAAPGGTDPAHRARRCERRPDHSEDGGRGRSGDRRRVPRPRPTGETASDSVTDAAPADDERGDPPR